MVQVGDSQREGSLVQLPVGNGACCGQSPDAHLAVTKNAAREHR